MTEVVTVIVEGVAAVATGAAAVQVAAVNTEAVGPPGPQGPPGEGVTAHMSDTTPHPAYDDLPSLSLLFESQLP